jgi:SNF2 family DNA or RNA helicase
MVAEILKDWLQEDPTAKALVFSSFTSLFDILTPFLRQNGLRVCEYSGRILPCRREMNLDSFKETAGDSPNVMLISYGCGAGWCTRGTLH